MSLINRNTDYAVRAVCFIAGNKKRITSVDDLARHLKIPRPFLRKILQILNKKRILKSYKGKNGGFSLAVLPERVFLIDMMRIFQGRFKLKDCLLSRKICPNLKTCVLRRKLSVIEDYVAAELEAISMASLLK